MRARYAIPTPRAGAAAVTVALASHHPVVRIGLCALIAGEPGVRAIAEAGDGHAVLCVVAAHRPDVLLMDSELPGGGSALCRRLRGTWPRTRVMVLTEEPEAGMVVDAVGAGASGLVLLGARPSAFVSAIRHAAGRAAEPGRSIEELLVEAGVPDDLALAGLHDRECRIVELVAKGRTNREIGREIGLAPKTVNNEVSRLLHKLNIPSRSALAGQAGRARNRAERPAAAALECGWWAA